MDVIRSFTTEQFQRAAALDRAAGALRSVGADREGVDPLDVQRLAGWIFDGVDPWPDVEVTAGDRLAAAAPAPSRPAPSLEEILDRAVRRGRVVGMSPITWAGRYA